MGGAKDDHDTRITKASPESLVWGIVGVFALGLGSIMGLMAMLKQMFNANIGLVIAFSLTILLFMLVIEAVFIALIFAHRTPAESGDDTVKLKGQATKELDGPPARVLTEPASSITEHTTRAFEPIYTQRKAE